MCACVIMFGFRGYNNNNNNTDLAADHGVCSETRETTDTTTVQNGLLRVSTFPAAATTVANTKTLVRIRHHSNARKTHAR